MNILMECKHTKTVKYFGITLEVPRDVKYLAVDGDGRLYSYQNKPENNIALDFWYDSAECYLVGEVDLEGQDWRETLREFAE